MSDLEKSRSLISRLARSRLVIAVTATVVASGLGGSVAAVASSSKTKTQGTVAVKGPLLGTFTTASGNAGPTLPDVGTYFVVVEAAIIGPSASAISGTCNVETSEPFIFSGSFSLPANSAFNGRFSFSGMLVVSNGNQPALTEIVCKTFDGPVFKPDNAQWWVEKVNT